MWPFEFKYICWCCVKEQQHSIFTCDNWNVRIWKDKCEKASTCFKVVSFHIESSSKDDSWNLKLFYLNQVLWCIVVIGIIS
jgi:uncharacterized protein YaeQ